VVVDGTKDLKVRGARRAELVRVREVRGRRRRDVRRANIARVYTRLKMVRERGG
jgi:hypothetical protein